MLRCGRIHRILSFRVNAVQFVLFIILVIASTWFFLSSWLPDQSKTPVSRDLQTEILRLSKDYVRSLSSAQRNLPDGPYVSATTAYALLQGAQENCVVLSERLLQFPDCESKLKWIRTGWKSDKCYAALGVDGTNCSFLQYLSEVENYCPVIENRRALFRQPPAQLNYDLNGLLRLLNISGHQSSCQFMGNRLKRMWSDWTDGLNKYAGWVGHSSHWESETCPFDPPWMDSDCTTYQWTAGNAGRPQLRNRARLNILLHMGLLTPESHMGIENAIGRGGPLGELVQWTDLLASLYLLGHSVTISMEVKFIKNLLISKAMLPCQTTGNVFDLVYTDIVGYRQLKPILSIPSCRFRILDSFGTEAPFNHGTQKSTWGGLHLNLKQFYTLFPHSPDNSFLGFVVERVNRSSARPPVSPSRKPIALVYGKEAYMWKDREEYLHVLDEFFEIYGNVMDPKKLKSFDFVHIHSRPHGQAYNDLLTSAEVMVGLGFPFEGPAPLEALANGLVFLNPRFSPPVGPKNNKFFENKPTSRSLTSQHPYLENFVGEPYSYLVDMNNATQIRSTVRRLIEYLMTNDIVGYRPFEFSPAGFLERINAYLVHQQFCWGAPGQRLLQSPFPSVKNASHSVNVLDSHRNVVAWPPPLTSLRIILAPPGNSCNQACDALEISSDFQSVFPVTDPVNSTYLQRRQESVLHTKQTKLSTVPRMICAPEHFPTVNNRLTIEKKLNFTCANVVFSDLYSAPYWDHERGTCTFQAESLSFSCSTEGNDSVRRICPCRDALSGQIALCGSCV
ncbi:unnamed protein product [Calicophoron daubneyi]|uniref:alpha-1,6-mannosyl-glycoprotein 6-beta-N-acetylglucosaminyltransferase n=1 Tax=Calicophoron daubneyi TaxID=300641 RepID=A0AAV2TNG4_CALDB